jgi:hypothetical protein
MLAVLNLHVVTSVNEIETGTGVTVHCHIPYLLGFWISHLCECCGNL